jgi:hypothetical protein
VQQSYQSAALEEVQKEHAKYFEALEQHPRLLVGVQVPSITGDGMETLRTSEDAKEWQEAVKSVLVKEVQAKAQQSMDESSDYLTTINSSIELFQKNLDLIPGTKGFDLELANRFTKLAEPYELRTEEGKLQGYTVPVQPLIEQLRAQVTAERQKAATPAPVAPAAQPTPQQQRAAEQARNTQGQFTDPNAPQEGIPSKAGDSSTTEDFSALFGTLGLPDLRI